MSLSRRNFTTQAVTAAGAFSFLRFLPPLDAHAVALDARLVQFSPDIEPLVRLIEDTPRADLLEKIVALIRKGTSYQELLSGLMLAGVRGIQPRPVGFKFHAVLVVNSAHLASRAAEDRDRWLPLLWSLDNFKASQARNKVEGDWRMAPVAEAKLPPAHQAKQRFAEAMDAWDEEGADAAVVSLARNFGANDVIEQFWRYGARDFRDIGHKAIYVANAWRTLQTIGWRHAEPVLRSLAYALLDHGGDANPAKNNHEADLPGRENLARLKKIPAAWKEGAPDAKVAPELMTALRSTAAADASAAVLDLLQRKVAPASIWDGIFLAAGEQLMRDPGIIGLHGLTTVNALHFAYQNCSDDETRRYALLQAAAFLPLFRRRMTLKKDLLLDRLEPAGEKKIEPRTILETLSKQKTAAASEALQYLTSGGSPKPLLDEARRLIFAKGQDSHDYKFSSAVLEDFYHVAPTHRPRFLAASLFWLRGAGDKDNQLIQRARAALA